MNVGPSQTIIAYDDEKAIPLNARDAMSGSPSPWNVLAIMPRQAIVRDRRLSVSVRERNGVVIVGLKSARLPIHSGAGDRGRGRRRAGTSVEVEVVEDEAEKATMWKSIKPLKRG